MSEQLFSQFSDLSKLSREKDQVLQLFKEISAAIDSLNEKGLLIDGAKNLGQLAKFMREFDGVQGKVSEGLEKVSRAQEKQGKVTLQDIEAIKKAKGVTDEYVASLVKLAQSKQVDAKGKEREKPMTAKNFYMSENMGAAMKEFGSMGPAHKAVSARFDALDDDLKKIYAYAAQFTRFGAVVEGVNADLDSAADHVHDHAEESKVATGKVKDHTDALKDNTTATEDNATAQEKWAKAIEAQKARAAQLVAGVSSEPVVNRMSDSLGENAVQRDSLKGQLADIRKAKEELSQLNTGEFAGQFTEDINRLAQAEEVLKIQISQANQFIRNQAKEFQAQKGSLDEMRAQLNQLNQTYDAMTPEAKAAEAGRVLEKQINDLTTAIKEGEYGTQRYFRNVGNYAESLSPVFDKLAERIAKLKEEQSALQKQGGGGVQQVTPRVGFVIPGTEGPERLNQINAELQTLEGLQQAVSKSSGSYAQQVRVLDNELQQMARNGGSAVGFVLEMKEALQDAKIQNLGNFEGSAKIIVEAFEQARVKVKALTETVGEGAPELQSARAELDALSRVVENPQFLNVAGKVGDATAEIKFFTKALNDMEAQDLKDSAVYRDVQARLAELTDQMGDTRAEIKALSSDTRGFDLMASSLGTVSSMFETAASAAVFFGASEEEVQQSIQQLVAIQNVSNGVRQIATDLTTKGTAANLAYTYVQNQLAIATNASAAATARLSAAMKLTTVGLVLAAVAGLVYLMSQLSKKQKEVVDSQKNINDIFRESAGEFAKATAEVNKFRVLIDQAKKGLLDKRDVVKQYNESIGKTTGQVKSLDEAERALTENGEAYIKMMFLKAAANLALEEAAKKAFEAEQARQAAGGVDQLPQVGTKEQTDKLKGVTKTILKTQQDSATQQADNLNKIANSLLAQATELSKKFNFNFFGGSGGGDKTKKGAGDDRLKNEEETRKALFEVRKRTIQDEINAYDTLAKDEKQSYRTRLTATAALYEAKQRLAATVKDFEISETYTSEQVEVTQAKKEVTNKEQQQKLIASITEKWAAKRRDIESSYNSEILKDQAETTEQIEELKKGKTDQEKSDREKAAQSEYDRIQHNLEVELDGIQEVADREQAVELERYKRGEITKEQYEQRKLDIEADARAKSLQAEIDYYKALVSISGLPEDKKKEALQQLHDLEEQLRQENLKREEDAANRKWELTQEFYARVRELGAELKDLTFSLFAGNIDEERQRVQDQMDLLDKKSQKEIQAIQASGDSEEQKAEKVRKVEVRAAAQKEQLERKQRQLEVERARFERIANITNIIGNTGAAVTKALPNIPLSIVVGAMGAAQLVKVLATQIPGYWTGTESAEEGYAQVAERGRELAVDPQGKLVVYERPAITYLKEGTRIYNNRETEQILREGRTVPRIAGRVVPERVLHTLDVPAPKAATPVPVSPVARVVPAHHHAREKAQTTSTTRSLSSYLQAPMITPGQVALDMHRVVERERVVMARMHQADRTGEAIREMKRELIEELQELRALKQVLKEISRKTGINIYNEQSVESRAEFRRLMKD